MSARLKIMFGFACFALLLPLIAMQFTHEVHWDFFDFGIAALLLSSSIALIELSFLKIKNRKIKIAICTGVVFLLLLLWAELAVGLFS